jgi:hypothetical protein
LTIPVSGVVQVVQVAAGRLNEDVQWQGKPLMTFAADLQDCGELVDGEAIVPHRLFFGTRGSANRM